MAQEGRLGHALDRDLHGRIVAAADHAGGRLERRGVDVEDVARDAQHLVPDLAGRLLDGAGAGDHRAAREAADAVRRALRVAAVNRDVGGIEPEQRGGHLGEGRLRALPERRDAGGDGGAPGPVHAQVTLS